jgi:hypothetical protein
MTYDEERRTVVALDRRGHVVLQPAGGPYRSLTAAFIAHPADALRHGISGPIHRLDRGRRARPHRRGWCAPAGTFAGPRRKIGDFGLD